MIGFAAVLAVAAAAAVPAAGAATGSLAVSGKSVALAHAVAFDAGAQIHLLVTDQALPPAEVSSEFKLALYMFQHKVNGFQVTLDSARKVIDVAYHWELSGKPCPGCFDVTVAGGAAGPLTGTIKSTAKGEAAAEKLKADIAFNAPFSKPSRATPPTR